MKLPDYESDHCTIFSDFFLGLNPADLLTERHVFKQRLENFLANITSACLENGTLYRLLPEVSE